MKVLLAASEAVPYIKSGGLADVVGALPKALARRRVDARIILPFYRELRRQELLREAECIAEFSIWLSWRRLSCRLFRVQTEASCCYLIENDYYFDRDGLYGYFDDGERFAFFGKAVLAAIPHLDFHPDILHCHDWQTAMAPVFRHVGRDIPEEAAALATVFTIHNIEYQGSYGLGVVGDVLGLSAGEAAPLEYRGSCNFMKGAIETSHRVTTVSPTYAQEIAEPFYGRGLDSVVRANAFKLSGILNGLDRQRYNPQTDRCLPTRFSKARPAGKARVKDALRAELGLEPGDAPIFGMIGRLVRHKGVDLVVQSFEQMMEEPIQMVILGTGEHRFEEFFRAKAAAYPGRVATITAFSDELARRIYAGSDFFLMPSISEPCGLAQMIALRYGSVPIVRETGGLRDTVAHYDRETRTGNGIRFTWATTGDFGKAFRYALELYRSPDDWQALVANALSTDLSWAGSALEYHKLYRSLL